jgi:hypothetical protein
LKLKRDILVSSLLLFFTFTTLCRYAAAAPAPMLKANPGAVDLSYKIKTQVGGAVYKL